jgi:hypothetical protein
MRRRVRYVAHRRLLGALGAACALAALVTTAPASADEELTDARKAYDRGAKAYDDGDYVTAAREASFADQLVPNTTALELALKSVVRVELYVLAMQLADRVEARADAPAPLRALAAEARARAVDRVGKIRVDCKKWVPCTATLDGAPFPFLEHNWVTVGPHNVRLAAAGRTQSFDVVVTRGQEIAVEAREPADKPSPVAAAVPGAAAPAAATSEPPPPARASEAPGVSPAWFWVGVAVTAAVGAGTIVSGVDTLGKHDDFVAKPSRDGSTDGQSAQTRTNVLIGATGAAAAVTLALGLFVVKF